jgi:nucleoside-diphosphate-sugar epimerase
MPRRATKAPAAVAVTGCSGYVGDRLVRTLCAEESIRRVLGFDRIEPRFSHDKFVFDSLDARDQNLETRLSGIDVLVHLAFVMDPIRDETLMRDVNVNGSENVFRCAGRAGVKRIVYTSSTVVYGAHPDNDVPLTEVSPLRANLDFSYAAHKLEVEYVVREFRDEYEDVAVTVFRPAIVFGRNVDNAWSHLMEAPVAWGIKGYKPPLQFVHEDDVADALSFAVQNGLDGIYNLAPSDWIDYNEIAAMVGRRRVDLPEPIAFSLAERLWSLNVAEAPAGMLHYVMHPWVTSPAKLESEGFKCSRSSRDALEEGLEQIRDHVRIGKSRMRKGDLVRGGAVGLGVIGAAALYLRSRRR